MNFVNPQFLYGLFVIAVPIAIHLFDLQRPKKIIFNNVALIKAINQKTASVRKVKEWLILITRILAVFFIVLAFAQPFLGEKINTIQNNDLQFFIDNSPSMSVANLHDQALQNVEKWTQSYPKNYRFRFFDQSFNSKDKKNINSLELKDRISESKITRQNHTFLEIYRNCKNNISNKKNSLIYISDFQKNALIEKSISEIDTNSSVVLVPISNPELSNVYVDSVWTENLFVKQNEKNKLNVSLKNTAEAKTVKLKLVIDNIQAGNVSATIDAKSKKTISFDFTINSSAPSICRIEIENDDVAFDNKFDFVLYPSSKINILNITAEPQKFIKRVFESENIFEIKENKFGLISQSDISKASFVVVDGFDLLQKSEISSLKEYINSGKYVLLLPSSKSSEKTISDALLEFNISNISYLKSDKQADNQTNIAALDANHPLFKNIFEKIDPKADMPFVKPVFEIFDKSNTIVKTKTDDVFLCSKAIGKGKIYICSTPFDEGFTNLMKHSIFVPLMYKMALSSLKDAIQLAFRMDENWVQLPIKNASSDKSMTLSNEKMSFIVQQKIVDGLINFNLPSDLPSAGVFQLAINDSLKIPLAFNISKSESQLNYYSVEELKKIFDKYKNVSILESEDYNAKVAEIKQTNLGFPLWKYCLIAALICLLVEIILIRYFK